MLVEPQDDPGREVWFQKLSCEARNLQDEQGELVVVEVGWVECLQKTVAGVSAEKSKDERDNVMLYIYGRRC